MEREQPDLIVSCGDLTWGPLPLETVALLEPWRERLLCVSGNSERELVERKLVDSEIARWEHEQHDRPELAGYLERTQPTVTVEVTGIGPTLFCHGSPRSDEECVTVETPADRVAEFTAGVEAACIVTAHTHMQYDRAVGETGCSTRAASACRTSPSRDTPTGRCSARTSSCAGRPTTSTRRSSGCAPAACRTSSGSRS